MNSIHLRCFELIGIMRKIPKDRLLQVSSFQVQILVYICFACNAALKTFTRHSFRFYSFYRSSPIPLAVIYEGNAIGKGNGLRGGCFSCSASVERYVCHDRGRGKSKCLIPIVLSFISVLIMNVKTHWERKTLYLDIAPFRNWGAAEARKYGIRVVEEGNSLKFSLIWPKPIVSANLLFGCARKTGFLLHDSEMVCIQAAVASAQTLSA